MVPVLRRVLAGAVAAGLLSGSGFALASEIKIDGVIQDGANGYLKGAVVCLDLDGNAACDAGEPVSISNANGKFKLKSSDPAAAQAAVVAEVPVIKPDKDDKRAVAAPFTLAAPAGYATVVNALTTLVHARSVADGSSPADAEARIGDLLGVAHILGHDYVAQGDAAAQALSGTVASVLAATQGVIADAVTEKVRLKMLIAIANEITLSVASGRPLDGVVVTRGDVFAAVVPGEAATNPRNAAADPGEVEVHAGLGYHKTLFDSANNKCQNCHNDLYDTWKQSMHAKSWADPVFQSLFQDYLRMSISRIGASGPGGAYTEAKFKGAAQVCIRCHAPAAYYSNDFDVQLKVLSENPLADYAAAKAGEEFNIAPAFNPDQVAKVVSLSKDGKVYQASYHIGNRHNREGINCAFCHSVETVRLKNASDGDNGLYRLARDLTSGPIGPVVYPAGSVLNYDWDGSDHQMNAFFMLTGPEKYADPGNTPKDAADFDNGKIADGRFTIASKPVGAYTGGPFYGPYGVTGTTNSRADDDLDRGALVNPHFVAAGAEQHFKNQGKALCLSCHQRSAGAINPESNGLPGVQVGSDQFMELCSTWVAVSGSPGGNFQNRPDAPKCQSCHMERLANKTVLHKWNAPSELFTAADGVTPHFDPDVADSLVALNTMNSHAFVGANVQDFGLGKLKSAFDTELQGRLDGDAIEVTTTLLNKTAHMLPGAHPMRRMLTRIVVTDAAGQRVPYLEASGISSFETVTNTLATIPGETVFPGDEQVTVEYDPSRKIVFPGQAPDLNGGAVSSQQFDGNRVTWEGSFGPAQNPVPVQLADGSWTVQGSVSVNKIIDASAMDHFTRIYGREVGKKDPADASTFLVRPGFDSNIARDNRLLPNERETYTVRFDATQVTAWPVTVAYKVYYLAKGANGQFPTGADGFLNMALPPATLKTLAIREVYSGSLQIAAP